MSTHARFRRASLSVLFRQAPDSMSPSGPALLLKATVELAFRGFLALGPIAGRMQEAWRFWDEAAPQTAQLYLCSEADTIVSASEVAGFRAAQVRASAANLIPLSARLALRACLTLTGSARPDVPVPVRLDRRRLALACVHSKPEVATSV